MKKMLIGLIFVLLTTFNGFAFDFELGFGGGGIFEMGFSNVDIKASNGTYHDRPKSSGGGFFFFFDMTYLETILGFSSFSYKPDANVRAYDLWSEEYDWTSMTFGLYGKIPFEVVRYHWTLFPVFGFDIQFFQEESIGGNTYDRDNLVYDGLSEEYFDDVWIRAGLGSDFYIGDLLYLRGEFLWGIKLNDQWEKDRIKKITINNEKPSSVELLTHGFQICFALGLRFKT